MSGGRMKGRFAIAAVVIAMLCAQLTMLSSAQAVSGTGSLLLGHPGTVTRGTTEAELRNVKVCSAAPITQGVDAWVVNVTGASGTLSVTSSVPSSLNLVFVNSGCFTIDATFGQGTSVSRAIPSGSKWVIISSLIGANISLSYSY